MTDPLTRERVETIRKGCDGVTEGPWESDSMKRDGATFFQVLSPIISYGSPASICDTLNAGVVELEQDDDKPWDEQGRKNMEHIANCDPATVRQLCDAFLALEDARAEIADWKDRYESERRDHEATIKHADARAALE